MKVDTVTLDGKKDGSIELPNIFETEIKKDVIHKAYINLESHGFQNIQHMQLLDKMLLQIPMILQLEEVLQELLE